MKIITMLFLLAGMFGTTNANVLKIRENLFYLDEAHFEMWGLRTASATQSGALTDKLLAALDEYQEVGLNTVSLYLQGSSGGYSDPFNRKGTRIDKDHWNRLVRIIEECNRRSMVVIIGIFYQRTMADEGGVRRLAHSEKSVFNAVKTVTTKLKPYKNVILNIANEQNSDWYRRFTAFDFRDPKNIIALCKYVKAIDPDRIVGGGGYLDESNITIGRSESVDVLLFDTHGEDIRKEQHSGWKYDYFRANGVKGKPIVNVETFGAWTNRIIPPGVFKDENVRKIHMLEVEEAAKRPGLSINLHNTPWCQGTDLGYETRYDLGGSGNEDDPGIRWFFEYAQSFSNTTDRGQSWPDNPYYLAWEDSPLFPPVPPGYYSCTQISRPVKENYHEQLIRLSRRIDDENMKQFGSFLLSEDGHGAYAVGGSLATAPGNRISLAGWQNTKPGEPLLSEFLSPDSQIALAHDKDRSTEGFLLPKLKMKFSGMKLPALCSLQKQQPSLVNSILK